LLHVGPQSLGQLVWVSQAWHLPSKLHEQSFGQLAGVSDGSQTLFMLQVTPQSLGQLTWVSKPSQRPLWLQLQSLGHVLSVSNDSQ
jgi:hypothetical protein